MIKYDRVSMETAKIWSKESKCTRQKVGAVITKNGRPISTGYNGLYTGMDDSLCELPCPVCNGYGTLEGFMSARDGKDMPLEFKTNYSCRNCQGTGKKTNPLVQHAERNALDFCTKEGIPTKGTDLFVTLSPCIECAKSILTAGVKRVVYLEPYKDLSGVDYLLNQGVEVVKYER